MMRLRKKSTVHRILDRVGDTLEAVSDIKKPSVPDVGAGKAGKVGLIAVASAVGLTAGSAAVSSVRRRSQRARDRS